METRNIEIRNFRVPNVEKNTVATDENKQVEKLKIFKIILEIFNTRFECGFPSSPLVSSVVSHLLCLLRAFSIFSTRFECSFKSSSLVSSVASLVQLGCLCSTNNATNYPQILDHEHQKLKSKTCFLHSFRVYFYIFPTRFECNNVYLTILGRCIVPKM